MRRHSTKVEEVYTRVGMVVGRWEGAEAPLFLAAEELAERAASDAPAYSYYGLPAPVAEEEPPPVVKREPMPVRGDGHRPRKTGIPAESGLRM